MIASGFSWWVLLPGVESGAAFAPLGHDLAPFLTTWLVCFTVLALAFLARRQLQAATAREGMEAYEADASFSLRNLAEAVVGGISGTMSGALGREDVRRFLPLIGGLMVYIFCCNITAIIPGFQPPTDNINVNFAMAVIVLVTYWGVGLSRDAGSFFKHMMGPKLALAALILPIELIGMLFVRPGSLAVRLTGNIFGDHAVFNIMSGLVPVGVPVAFLALATLVSLIQAFVFGLLTTIYISLSLPHAEHDEAHAEPAH